MNWGNLITTLCLGFGFLVLKHHDDMPSDTWRDWLRSGPSGLLGWILLSAAVSRLA